MMQIADETSLHYTVSRPESVAGFNRVIESYLASRKDTPDRLEQLIKNDPDMAMARCFRGYLLKLAADRRFVTPIDQIVRDLERVKDDLAPREQQHVEALARWAANDMTGALRLLEQICAEHPKDMVALRVAHYLHFYAGASADMRDSVARAVAAASPTDPFYGYLLGMYSFGLEEAGDYERAEAAGRDAVERNEADIWAAHAVAHVFQMQSRFDEGVEWAARLLPTWSEANNFVYHMYWHQALCHIGKGELDAALALYDAHLTDCLGDDFYLDVCNAAALLWRLEMLGVSVGNRWDSLKMLSERRVTDDELLFATLHYLMTPARLRDDPAIERGLAHFRTWCKQDSTQGALCSRIGLPLAEAIVALGRGDRETATSILSEHQDDIVLIGGSHAQRDLFALFREYAG